MERKVPNFKVCMAWLLIISLLCTSVGQPMYAKAASIDCEKVTIEEKSCIYKCDEVCIVFTVSEKWETGYNAVVRVTNISSSKIENWHLKMMSEDEIASAWNADIQGDDSNIYDITNLGWNQDIEVGSSVEFGYHCSNGFCDYPEFSFISSSEAETDIGKYDCQYSVVSDWGIGFNGQIAINNTTDEIIKEWSLTFEFDNEIDNIWNAEILSHEGSTYVIKGLEYNQNIASGECIFVGFTVNNGEAVKVPANFVLSSCINNITDVQKILSGRDELDKDSDHDGVPDFLEYLLGLDPENPNTIGNGCSDYDGAIAFARKHLSGDSDGDGISDFSELMYGLNPYKADSYDDGINDSDRQLKITKRGTTSDVNRIVPYVSMEVLGSQLDGLGVNKISDDNVFLNSSIPGYLGNAYDLSVSGDFNGATLKFELPEEILNDPDIIPTIYYWNESTQRLEELENQYAEDNKVCVDLNHFSSYALLDKVEYDSFKVKFDILAPVVGETLNSSFHMVLSLDESGSISDSNYRLMKESAANLVSGFAEDDRVAVYTFDGTVRKICSFVEKDRAAEVIKSLEQHYTWTAIKDAALSAIDEFANCDSDGTSKMIILLTDGESNKDKTNLSYEQIAGKAFNNNITIYTIGVGSVNKNALETLAHGTGGQYYHISDFSKLTDVFGQVISDADLYLDSDQDGISDYHEKRIAQGQLRLGSGAALSNECILDYLNPDSDGDGLIDGDELIVVEEEGVVFCKLFSDPTSVNSDSDEFDDYAEYMMGSESFTANYVKDTDSSDINAAAASVIGDISLPGIWIGTWLEMAKSHYWGYIHAQVLKKIEEENPDLLFEHKVSTGRVDIYNPRDNIFWEVKPISYYTKPAKKALAMLQMERYEGSIEGCKRGGLTGIVINPTPFVTDDGQYIVTYANSGEGLIYYSFKKIKNPPKPNEAIGEKPKDQDKEQDKDQEQPNSKPVEMTEEEEEAVAAIEGNCAAIVVDDAVMEQICNALGITVMVGATAFAAILVAALLADDVTVAGIADDPAIAAIIAALVKGWQLVYTNGVWQLIPGT